MKKLKWGMIGGGEGSQIGPAHRLGSGLDGLFEFTAGALDHRPKEGIDYGQRLGLGERAYGSWQDMLAAEKNREDKIDWTVNRFGFLRTILWIMVSILAIALLARMFI